LAVIAVVALAAGTFAMVSPSSHHGQWSSTSLKIGGEERRFPSQLAIDQKSKVSSSTPICLYHRGKLMWLFGTHALDNARRAMRLGFFAI
jgi:hypothetical protein